MEDEGTVNVRLPDELTLKEIAVESKYALLAELKLEPYTVTEAPARPDEGER